MADDAPQKSAEEQAAEEQMLKAVSGEPGAAAAKPAGGAKWFLIVCVGVVALAAGVGYLASSLPALLGRSGPSQAAAETPEPDGSAAAPAPEDKHEGKAEAKAETKTESKPPAKESKPAGKEGDKGITQGGEFTYYDFEAVVANLDEPRLARYIRVVVTLAVKRESFPGAQGLLEKKKPELRHWLTIYFSNCKLDDVRGAPNLNRIQREILDALNNQLWPNQKPLIDHVLFKEFAVS